MPTCQILMGASGSGKSTLAKQLAEQNNALIASADYFFYGSDGVYNFDREKLGQAHNKCWSDFISSVIAKQNVVVDNTNTRWSEMKRYIFAGIALDCEVSIHEPTTDWRYNPAQCALKNKHNVPLAVVEGMVSRILALKLTLLKHNDLLVCEKQGEIIRCR